MSDTKTFGLKTFIENNFISLEHGTKFITLSIIESGRKIESLKSELTPLEAMKLARDLIRRTRLIRKGGSNDGTANTNKSCG